MVEIYGLKTKKIMQKNIIVDKAAKRNNNTIFFYYLVVNNSISNKVTNVKEKKVINIRKIVKEYTKDRK
jgi:hypothetical protein